MYGQKALELLKELSRSDSLPAYNVGAARCVAWAGMRQASCMQYFLP